MKNKKCPKRKRLGQGLFILSILFLAFGLFSIGWVLWPTPREAVTINSPEGVLPGSPSGEVYASLADYTLSLTWPRWLRAGQGGRIRVNLSEDESNGIEVEDRPVQVVMVETSLSPLRIEPSGQIQVSIGQGQDLALDWGVSGSTPGVYSGEVIVSFGFYDQDLAELVPVPVAVVDIEVRVLRLFGLQSQLILWFGLVGLVFWGAFFLLGRMVQKRLE